ncbi:MAG: glucosamine-6-phosphate deaminase [Senegalia sp. (in: firmicutes)]|uniref:glucosamine-6-phosphate deaminase n=1 Tax=Senegalia sp. (in: firmicutes) TaxID=1924098 RepID=UPI003F9DF626
MKIIKVKNYEEMSKRAAFIIASQVSIKEDSVLGLATGSTPIGTYKQIINIYNDKLIDFKNITTYNLDEYYDLSEENEQSYRCFMNQNLFNHINIDKKNTFVPNGKAENPEKECKRYDSLVEKSGNIDLQILGIGSNAHIGFNEPDDKFAKGTHLVDLKQETIDANARFFKSKEEVPKKAISMGMKNIMAAKKVILLASGENKAQAIKSTIEGPINPSVPASILQLHPDVTFILDEDAASRLNK